MAFAGFRLSSTSKTVIETASSELAHISRVCLTQYDAPCKYLVQLEVEKGRPYCIGILSDRCPQIMLEHYIQNGSTVWLEGKGEATADLTGYVEPAYSFSDEDDEEVSSNESELEAAEDTGIEASNFRAAVSARVKAITDAVNAAEAENAKAKQSNVVAPPPSQPARSSDNDSDVSDEADTDATKASATKNASPSGDVEMDDDDEDEEDDDEEEVDEEEDDDEEDDDEDDDDEEDDEEDEEDDEDEVGESESEAESASEEVTIVEPKQQQPQQKGHQQQNGKSNNKSVSMSKSSESSQTQTVSGKKRKGEPIAEAAQAAKKKAGPEAEYERALVEELRRLGGRTKISMLGAKISRPAGLTVKLGAFLKDHPASFVCDGPNVELASKAM